MNIDYRKRLIRRLKELGYHAYLNGSSAGEPSPSTADEEGYEDEDAPVLDSYERRYFLEQFDKNKHEILNLVDVFVTFCSDKDKIEECLRGFLTQKTTLDQFNKLVEKIFN